MVLTTLRGAASGPGVIWIGGPSEKTTRYPLGERERSIRKSNTKDSKSHAEALKEAAEALEREAKPLADDDSESLRKVIKRASALKKVAEDLKHLSKGLRWIAEPLVWIAKPLKRASAALMKMTPAEMNEPEAEEALNATADALSATAMAATNGGLVDHSPMPSESHRRLEKIENSLPDRLYNFGHRPMHLIAKVLMDTAEAVRSADPENLRTQAYYLDEIIAAIENAKADETAQKA